MTSCMFLQEARIRVMSTSPEFGDDGVSVMFNVCDKGIAYAITHVSLRPPIRIMLTPHESAKLHIGVWSLGR